MYPISIFPNASLKVIFRCTSSQPCATSSWGCKGNIPCIRKGPLSWCHPRRHGPVRNKSEGSWTSQRKFCCWANCPAGWEASARIRRSHLAGRWMSKPRPPANRDTGIPAAHTGTHQPPETWTEFESQTAQHYLHPPPEIPAHILKRACFRERSHHPRAFWGRGPIPDPLEKGDGFHSRRHRIQWRTAVRMPLRSWRHRCRRALVGSCVWGVQEGEIFCRSR